MELSILLPFLLYYSILEHNFAHGQGSSLKKFVAMAQPEQIHIALGNTAQDMIIMWATKKHENTYVEIANTVKDIQKIGQEWSQQITFEEENDRGAKYIHRVYVSNLIPGERYVYRIICDSGTNSNMFSFNVPKTEPKRVHTFMVLADMGLSSKSLKFLTYEARTGKYEAVFHIGDIAYNLDRDQGNFGDLFLKQIETFSASVPYMTVPGDHERYHDYVHYRHRFSMPNTPWPMPTDQLWYSIDVGPVHFVTINTEVFYTLPQQLNKQLQWLRADLKEANTNRDQAPWIIVLGHRPMYCSLTDADNPTDLDCANETTSPLRSELEDLFFEEGVDLYISGHRHNYERSWPLYRGKAFQQGYKNPKAPIYIVNGAMGYEYITETISKPYQWSAFQLADGNKELYGKLEVLNSTHLKWDMHAAANNEHEDSILIIQSRHGSFGKAGDDAYETLIKLQQLPPAPFHWEPPAVATKDSLVNDFYSLPPETRKVYLMTLCCTLLAVIVFLLAMPCVRRKIFRRLK